MLTTMDPQELTPQNWAAALETGTREVFQVMLESELERLPDAEPPRVADLTAMIGLAGELRGVISIRCSVDAAARMASKMLGVSLDEAYESVRDAIGEVCNMVAGKFKLLTERNDCMISVPTVISGEDYDLYLLGENRSRTQVCFGLDGLPLWVTLDLNTEGKG